MCRIRFAIFAILLGFCTAADIASGDEAEAWTALHAGRHVALMRHTDAPGGAGDPPGFRVDDCATQRNLSAKGRADALRIGARLRSEGIAIERILSSPWCRCMDTATLLELGPVEAEPTFGNVVVLRDQRELPDRRCACGHRQMDRERNPSCRDARCEHSRAHGHLTGERRDRRARKEKRRRQRKRRSPDSSLTRNASLFHFFKIPAPRALSGPTRTSCLPTTLCRRTNATSAWVKTGKAQYEQMFSALHPTTDITKLERHVRKVPNNGSGRTHSITSSARERSVGGIMRPMLLAVLRLTINSK